MTTEEFSNEFDVLVSSYRRFKNFDDREILDSIDFNEYEKSTFLTQAQEDIVIHLYNGINPLGESFENTEELRSYLKPLIREKSLYNQEGVVGHEGIVFDLPDDLWYITYEEAELENASLCNNNSKALIYPVTQDEYFKIKRNPFRGVNSNRVLRLDLNDNKAELISKYKILEYYLRYLSKPEPIILCNFPNNITINNKNIITECKLNSALHRPILEKAVRIALLSKNINTESN